MPIPNVTSNIRSDLLIHYSSSSECCHLLDEPNLAIEDYLLMSLLLAWVVEVVIWECRV